MESNPTTPNSNMATHCALCALLDKKSPSIESKKIFIKNYFDSATLASSLRNLNGIDSCTNEADFAQACLIVGGALCTHTHTLTLLTHATNSPRALVKIL